MSLIDSYGKTISYLRLAVTDRCNLHCTYCMPGNGMDKLPHERILSLEDLLRVARATIECGINKVHVTGGEPLVRKGLIPFLRELSVTPGLKQLILSTNGILLDDMAEELRSAGVQRLNICLNSLDEDTYATITRGGDFAQALRGIAAAERAGLPIKLNMVVMRGVNDNEITDFARLTIDGPVTVRFIEFMPDQNPECRDNIVHGTEIIARLTEKLPLEPARHDESTEPATEFKIAGAKGNIVIITPDSGHACRECNRIRVTATGIARSCLFSSGELDLRPYLETENHSLLTAAIRGLATAKAEKRGIRPADHLRAFSI